MKEYKKVYYQIHRNGRPAVKSQDELDEELKKDLLAILLAMGETESPEIPPRVN